MSVGRHRHGDAGQGSAWRPKIFTPPEEPSAEWGLGEFFDRYYTQVVAPLEGLDPKTVELTVTAFKWWRLATGDPPIAEVERSMRVNCDRYVAYLRDVRENSAATVAKHCRHVSAVWSKLLPESGEPQPRHTVVFRSGESRYHTYRIPAAVVTTQGAVLAFCEGRKDSQSDSGDIDVLLRRSFDGGKTWEPMRTIWDDGGNTCGNPCAVVDESTGHVWLLLTWNHGGAGEGRIRPGWGEDSRRVFVTHSEDEGVTWSNPTEITADVKDRTWSWYATGPGAGIQIQHGEHRGRLVIPCDHKLWQEGATPRYYSHVIYSDDHGVTWRRGEATPEDQVNECEVVEVANGRLLLNMRNYDRSVHARQIAFSDDGGDTWQDQPFAEALVEPRCQASIRRLSWPEGDHSGAIVFSNPAHGTERVAMTVRASFDDGRTWPRALTLHPGSSAYSCLVNLADGSIGCLYEVDSYGKIVFDRFTLDQLKPANSAK